MLGILLSALTTLALAKGSAVVCDDVREPLTLDPQKEFSAKNHTLLQQVYEGLLRFGPDGKIEPALAVSWERKDPLTTRLRLRGGVTFHDGEAFDAEAVAYSIRRYLDPATGFPALGFISSLDRAEVVDPLTVDIVTKFPDGLILNRLAGFIVIVPPKYVKEKGEAALSEHPVGTGPFVFERWERGKRIVLKANAAYWKPGAPELGELVFEFIPLERQVQSLLAGKVQLLTDLAGTETTGLAEKGLKVLKDPSFYTYGASFDTSRPPLSDLRVRRALNLAVNRAELIRFDALGNGVPLATLAMPGEEGRNPSLEPYPYDPKKARELLAEAGYAKGFALDVFVKVQGERTFRILKGMLERVGVTLNGTVVTDADMFQQLKARKWDVIFGDCPDPMAHAFFVQAILLYSKSPFSVMKEPAYDQMLEGMLVSLDPKDREAKAEALDKYVYDNALSLFTYQRVRTYGLAKGVSFQPWATGMPYFDRLSVAPEAVQP